MSETEKPKTGDKPPEPPKTEKIVPAAHYAPAKLLVPAPIYVAIACPFCWGRGLVHKVTGRDQTCELCKGARGIRLDLETLPIVKPVGEKGGA